MVCFIFFLATLLCSSLTLLIRFCMSNHSEFKCFCVKVKKDVEVENKKTYLGTEKL